MNSFARLVALSAAVAMGWAIAETFRFEDIDQSSIYLYFVTSLLALGIYGCTRGILLTEFKHNLRVVLLAVTFGVLMKAALIAAVLVIVFQKPEYAILGIVVAQIDPLSVSAMRVNTRISDSANAILSAWSSFDDPITVLLTIYFSAFALQAQRVMSPVDGALFGGDLQSFGVNLGANFLFAACAYGLWKVSRASEQWFVHPVTASRQATTRTRQAIALLALLAAGAVAVVYALILGLALIGLFFRPAIGEVIERMTQVALLVAACALGLLLVDGIQPVPGLVLGGAAYGAQIVTAQLLTRRQPRRDRVHLALGQQNGVTAIALALLLEPTFSGTVAIVAPAILVINLLHAVCNGVWDWFDRKRSQEEPNSAGGNMPPQLEDAQDPHPSASPGHGKRVSARLRPPSAERRAERAD